jgi:hypothetical protein
MRRMLRSLFLCLCAAVGFAGTASLIHRLAPLKVPEVTPKLAYLQAHLGDFDTLFIGSSRVYHGVSPRIFDAATAAAGKPTHSFNLGTNGMFPPESLHIARTILAMRPPRLRRIFLEVASAHGLPDAARPTIRQVYWQDFDALLYAIRRARLDYPVTERKYRLHKAWQEVSDAATLFARNQLNIGRFIPDPDALPNQAYKTTDLVLGPDRDGFFPAPNVMTGVERHQFAIALASMRDGTAKPHPGDSLNRQDYLRIRDLIAGSGIELILLITPSTTRDYHAALNAPSGPRLLAFDDPVHYPEFYLPERRFDYDHLNDVGATIFSQELAKAYVTGN